MANEVCKYQLRRIGPPATCPDVVDVYRITQTRTLIGRNKYEVDLFLFSCVHPKLISRIHAEIECKPNEIILKDVSANGTFVNHVKVSGYVSLHDGDIVVFGHLDGILIKPGALAPQPRSEFQFQFERISEEIKEEIPPPGPALTNPVLTMKWNTNVISPMNNIISDKYDFPALSTIIPNTENNRHTPVHGLMKASCKPRQILPSQTNSCGSSLTSSFDQSNTELEDLELLNLAAKVGDEIDGFDSDDDIFSGGHRRGSLSPILGWVQSENRKQQKIGKVAPKKRRTAPYQKKKNLSSTTKKTASTSKQWDMCDFYDCRQPQDDTVDWVQCDDCDGWYHVHCVGCNVNAVKDPHVGFHCGCN
ncbi:transcription factor 19-like [Saccoglossus kowalevskii]|uniref:Transcription factor 19-like n=1 Tax=Saccoglossus kowalevskii TaxID=10224 RepID=A0ABM0MKB6_SACKO|nr:PREDICTED: transcription factor 19-like [Saccoglossus kowalevskii]